VVERAHFAFYIAHAGSNAGDLARDAALGHVQWADASGRETTVGGRVVEICAALQPSGPAILNVHFGSTR
jgi:hypothetical protein